MRGPAGKVEDVGQVRVGAPQAVEVFILAGNVDRAPQPLNAELEVAEDDLAHPERIQHLGLRPAVASGDGGLQRGLAVTERLTEMAAEVPRPRQPGK